MNKNNKILTLLRKQLNKIENLQVSKIILFGSQITGKATENSDFDILIILNRDYDWKIENAIYDAAYDVMLEFDVIMDIKIINQTELSGDRGSQPFIKNALKSKVYA